MAAKRTALGVLGAAVLLAGAAWGQTVTIVAGDGQNVSRSGYQVPGGIARFAPLRVLLRDPAGRPAPGQPVTFTCRTSRAFPCQLTPGGGENGVLTVTSGPDGVASLDRMNGSSMSLYYAEGAFTVEARWAGAAAVFHLSVPPAPPPPPVAGAQLVPLGGDNQRLTFPEQNQFGPLRVQLRDGAGRPVAGAPVTFSCRVLIREFWTKASLCQASPSGLAFEVVPTGPDGVATLDRMFGHSVWVLYAPSALEVTASYRDVSCIFHLLAVPSADMFRRWGLGPPRGR